MLAGDFCYFLTIITVRSIPTAVLNLCVSVADEVFVLLQMKRDAAAVLIQVLMFVVLTLVSLIVWCPCYIGSCAQALGSCELSENTKGRHSDPAMLEGIL